MMGRRPLTIKDDDQLRVLAATGETSGSIAVRLKRSAAAIRKRAISSGIVLAGSTKAPGLKAKRKSPTMSIGPSLTAACGWRLGRVPGTKMQASARSARRKKMPQRSGNAEAK
jgi:hypothetical protein